MAYNFKSLADVELLKTTSDGVNLIAEEDGKIVKVAVEDVASGDAVKSINSKAPDENGNIIVNELPENTQANRQLVTDANGAAKWEERLAYVGTERTEALPTTVVTMTAEDWLNVENSGRECLVSPEDVEWKDYTQAFRADFASGKRYLVVWDGVEYECEVHTIDGSLALGNYALSGWGNEEDDNGLPFLFIHYYGLFLVAKVSGEHTFTIYGEPVETVKTIDPKYLPESNSGLNIHMTKGDCIFPLTTIAGTYDHYPDESKWQDDGSLAAVYYNGELYVCQYKSQTVHNMKFYEYWGNLYLYDENYADTGEPFCYVYNYDGDAFHICGKDESFSFEVYACEVIRIPSAMVDYDQSIILRSSSAQSKKRFKITVNDDGEITATEVT